MDVQKIKYLVELYGGKSYQKCANEKISKTMHEFADKKLKDRNEKVIKNKKQAIAIALSQANSQCKYNPDEKKSLINKVNADLNSDKELNLSNIIEIKKAIGFLQAKGKGKQIYVFKNLLWNKIITTHIHGKFMDQNMWEEVKQIQKI